MLVPHYAQGLAHLVHTILHVEKMTPLECVCASVIAVHNKLYKLAGYSSNKRFDSFFHVSVMKIMKNNTSHTLPSIGYSTRWKQLSYLLAEVKLKPIKLNC